MSIDRVKSNGNHVCKTCGRMIWAKDEHYLDSESSERVHIACPEVTVDKSEDHTYKRFLNDLWRSYRFNYTQWERDFITKNIDRDIEQWPYSRDQRKAIDKLMKKFLPRM